MKHVLMPAEVNVIKPQPAIMLNFTKRSTPVSSKAEPLLPKKE